MSNTSGNIYELFEAMNTHHVFCAYHGEFTHEVINVLLKNARENLHHQNVEQKTLKKTYNVLVECLENVQKHANKYQKSTGSNSDAMFALGREEDGLFIHVGNMIGNHEINELRRRIDEVNAMDREQLKSSYREGILNGSISDRGGAGLGIIDIAMKSGNELHYAFYEQTHQTSFFTLRVKITGK